MILILPIVLFILPFNHCIVWLSKKLFLSIIREQSFYVKQERRHSTEPAGIFLSRILWKPPLSFTLSYADIPAHFFFTLSREALISKIISTLPLPHRPWQVRLPQHFSDLHSHGYFHVPQQCHNVITHLLQDSEPQSQEQNRQP